MNLFLPSQSGFRWLRLYFLNLFQTFSLVQWSLNFLNMLLKIRNFKENLYRMVLQGKFSFPFVTKYVHFLWLGRGGLPAFLEWETAVRESRWCCWERWWAPFSGSAEAGFWFYGSCSSLKWSLKKGFLIGWAVRPDSLQRALPTFIRLY